MLSQIAIENQIADEMDVLYRNADSIFECDNLLKEFGATIRMHTSSDETTDDPQEFNYAIAMALHKANTQYHAEKTQHIAAIEELTSSRSPATIEASNATTTASKENNMNATINLESMTINELAALQLKIAQRINDLLMIEVNPKKECDIPQEKLEDDVVPTAAKTTRVKKSKVSDAAPKPKPDMAVVAQVAKQVEKNDEQVRKAIAAKASAPAKAESKPAAPTGDVSKMKYADLRSYISKTTKSNIAAKELAQSIARKYGTKSWATVGRDGYEEIYELIIEL